MSTMASDVLHRPATQRLLWRGALYETLALAFSYPSDETVAELDAALDSLREHEITRAWGGRALLGALITAHAGAELETLAAAHTRLFAGEVPCSTCETEHEFDAFAKARQLADIAGFYRAFGLKVAADRPAPADAIATELEFLSHLAMRQAVASVNGWEDRGEICLDARRTFLEDHLGRWVPLFCATVAQLDDAASFYGAAAALCEQFLREEIADSGARPRPAMARRGAPDDAHAFRCMFAAPEDGDKEDEP